MEHWPTSVDRIKEATDVLLIMVLEVLLPRISSSLFSVSVNNFDQVILDKLLFLFLLLLASLSMTLSLYTHIHMAYQ